MLKIDARIASLEARLTAARAKLKGIEARKRAIENRQKRKDDLRRKFLIGSAVLDAVERGDWSRHEVFEMLGGATPENRVLLEGVYCKAPAVSLKPARAADRSNGLCSPAS